MDHQSKEEDEGVSDEEGNESDPATVEPLHDIHKPAGSVSTQRSGLYVLTDNSGRPPFLTSIIQLTTIQQSSQIVPARGMLEI